MGNDNGQHPRGLFSCLFFLLALFDSGREEKGSNIKRWLAAGQSNSLNALKKNRHHFSLVFLWVAKKPCVSRVGLCEQSIDPCRLHIMFAARSSPPSISGVTVNGRTKLERQTARSQQPEPDSKTNNTNYK